MITHQDIDFVHFDTDDYYEKVITKADLIRDLPYFIIAWFKEPLSAEVIIFAENWGSISSVDVTSVQLLDEITNQSIIYFIYFLKSLDNMTFLPLQVSWIPFLLYYRYLTFFEVKKHFFRLFIWRTNKV